MHEITLKPEPDHSLCTASSEQLFYVTGRGVPNRTFRHQINRYRNDRGCTLEGEHLHFMAVPGVISLAAQAAVETLTVAVDELIKVDGKEYTVTARRMADPILWPVEEPAESYVGRHAAPADAVSA